MKSSNIQKINNLGKAGDILCRIAKVCLVFCMVVFLVCGLLFCLIPRNALRLELTTESSARVYTDTGVDLSRMVDLSNLEGSIQLNSQEFQISANSGDAPVVNTVDLYLADLKWMMFALVIGLVPSYVLIHFGGKLCRHFKDCQTPFTQEAADGFVRLAWCLIPVAVMASVMEALAEYLTTGELDIVLSFDVPLVLLILCVFLISFVFKHGVALQAEVDETL